MRPLPIVDEDPSDRQQSAALGTAIPSDSFPIRRTVNIREYTGSPTSCESVFIKTCRKTAKVELRGITDWDSTMFWTMTRAKGTFGPSAADSPMTV